MPENEDLLNWDKPFYEQSEKIQKILGDYLSKIEKSFYNAKTGKEIYKGLSRSPKQASKILNNLGIPGLYYLDQQSRDDNNGTHNFVIWNTKTLEAIGISTDSDESVKDYAQKTAEKKGKNIEIFV